MPMPGLASPRVGAPSRRERPAGAWLLTAALVAVTVVLYVEEGRHRAAAPLALPWWLLAALFAAADTLTGRLRFSRSAHTVDLAGIPFVLGLFLAGPSSLLAARLVGAVAALGPRRWRSPWRLVFSVVSRCLPAAVGLALFRHLAAPVHTVAPDGWAAALLATAAAVVVAVLLRAARDAVVVGASSGRLRRLPTTLTRLLGVAALNTGLALIGVSLLWHDPWSGLLLTVPAALLGLAYRAYRTERDQHERLDLLHETTRAVSAAAEIETAVVALLGQARLMFRAEVAEITLFGTAPGEAALRTTIGPGATVGATVAVEPTDPEFPLDGPLLLRPPISTAEARRRLSGRRFRGAMLAPLAADGRRVGTLLIADRSGAMRSFDGQDLQLLEALAGQATVALQHGRLEKSIDRLGALERQLRHQAFHDPLTGLANRALFFDRLEHALAARTRGAEPVSVLLLDLDDFKAVNDGLGHDAGDELLVAAAARLTTCLRPGDTPARLGGDEFAVLLAPPAPADVAVAVAERILAALTRPLVLAGREVIPRASIGVAETAAEEAAAALVRNADAAMYRAKRLGKGRCAVFEPDLHAAAVARVELRSQLQGAVERSEFALRYQPQVDLRSGRVVGAEALVRWRHPTRGLLDPTDFLAYAEETGLIVAVGEWVLADAIRQAAAWPVPDQGRVQVAVNVSGRQLAAPGLPAELHRTLTDQGLPAAALVLEVSEGALLRDDPAVLSTLSSVRELGVRLALDGFGTGNASLSYLRRHPVDLVKIAKSFVDDITGDGPGTALTDAVIRMAGAFGVRTVAAGVERSSQHEVLRRLGCDAAQGYLYARPLRAEQFAELLTAQPLLAGPDPSDGPSGPPPLRLVREPPAGGKTMRS